MTRIIILYGLILTLVAFGLTWLKYRFWMQDIGAEIYGLAIALLFAALGVWIERQRHRPKLVRHAGKNEMGRNEKAIRALGLTTREIDVLECLRLEESNKRNCALIRDFAQYGQNAFNQSIRQAWSQEPNTSGDPSD